MKFIGVDHLWRAGWLDCKHYSMGKNKKMGAIANIVVGHHRCAVGYDG